MVVLAALLFVAIMLLFYTTRKESIRWLVGAVCMGCLGILGFVIKDSVLPDLQAQGEYGTQLYSMLTLAEGWLFFLYDLSLYSILMFAIVYSGLANRKSKIALACLLPIPIVILDVFPSLRHLAINDAIMLMLSVIYTATASFLLIYSMVKEIHPRKRRERFLTSFVIVPALLFAVLANVIVNISNPEYEQFQYVPAYAGDTIFIVTYLIFAFRYGIFGIKVVLTKQMYDQAFKGIASGTLLINHALKNRITNIYYLTKQIKSKENSLQPIHELDVILGEAEQIMAMVKRIQSQIGDIHLNPELCELTELVENALLSHRALLENRSITVVKEWKNAINVRCDKAHLQEVFYNILGNAIAAIKDRPGTIQIRIEEKRRRTLVEISDNGEGIDKSDLSKIFDPFFSTKPDADHFGLGLSYCYLVMQMHRGTIDAASIKNKGTTFTLTLPARNRILNSIRSTDTVSLR